MPEHIGIAMFLVKRRIAAFARNPISMPMIDLRGGNF